MEELPQEITLHILKNLQYKELCNAALVSKSFKKICEDDALWKILVIDKFGYVDRINNNWVDTYKYFSKYDTVYVVTYYDELHQCSDNPVVFAYFDLAIKYIIEDIRIFCLVSSVFYPQLINKCERFDPILLINFTNGCQKNHHQYKDMYNVYYDEMYKFLLQIQKKEEPNTYIYSVTDIVMDTNDWGSYVINKTTILRTTSYNK